jgi:hypothetical protein
MTNIEKAKNLLTNKTCKTCYDGEEIQDFIWCERHGETIKEIHNTCSDWRLPANIHYFTPGTDIVTI